MRKPYVILALVIALFASGLAACPTDARDPHHAGSGAVQVGQECQEPGVVAPSVPPTLVAPSALRPSDAPCLPVTASLGRPRPLDRSALHAVPLRI